MKTSENWMKNICTQIDEKHRNIEENHWKMEENHGTIEGTMEENHGTIEENHGKICENHGQINENHGKLDKNHGTNSETSGEIDEQCEWGILATKCSNWKKITAKTKEGNLDDKKNCQLNSAPDLILYVFIILSNFYFFHFPTPLNF